MKLFFQVVIVATSICISTAAIPQKTPQELLQEIESSRRAAQLEMEINRLRWQQLEAETARHHAESDRLRAETDRLRVWNESQQAADRAREIAGWAERAAEKRAEAAKEAAEELQDEMEQAAVRSKNNIYLVALLLLTAGFVTWIVRKSSTERFMQENQKFGIAAIIGAALFTVFAIMISDGWVYRFDFVLNLMSSLRIRLLEGDYEDYYVDIPTKYVVLTCISAAAYGLTTYLGITPVPRTKVRKTNSADTE